MRIVGLKTGSNPPDINRFQYFSNDGVSAKEAWERRKNYDPLIASGNSIVL